MLWNLRAVRSAFNRRAPPLVGNGRSTPPIFEYWHARSVSAMSLGHRGYKEARGLWAFYWLLCQILSLLLIAEIAKIRYWFAMIAKNVDFETRWKVCAGAHYWSPRFFYTWRRFILNVELLLANLLVNSCAEFPIHVLALSWELKSSSRWKFLLLLTKKKGQEHCKLLPRQEGHLSAPRTPS